MLPRNVDRHAANSRGGGILAALIIGVALLAMLGIMIITDPGALPVRTAN